MSAPKLLKKLFGNSGFGKFLNLDILPNHNTLHAKNGRDELQLDATQITTGIINEARLPASVKERLKKVQSNGDMLLLTKNDVQNGDRVLVLDTGIWYEVIDDNNLNLQSSYVALGATGIFDGGGGYVTKAITAKRFETPIDIILSGVNGKQKNWDGSTNINVTVTSIDDNLVSQSNNLPVVYSNGSYNIIDKDKNTIICFTGGNSSSISLTDAKNGWNCYLKNNYTSSITITPSSGTIDGQPSLKLPPYICIRLIYDGENYITISTMPIATTSK